MLKLVKRAEWGARAPRSRTPRTLSGASTGHWNGNKIVISGSVTWDHSRCASIVRGIQNFHMDENGWVDIAYNFVECPHGYTFEGRGLNVVSAANGTNTANQSSHAIMCLAGQGNPFPDAEKVGFRSAVKYVGDNTAAPDQCVGHRDHKPTACPGDERYHWIRVGMPTPQPAGNPTLRKGDRGDAVYTVQRIIHDKAGGNLYINNIFDDQTEIRVKDVQRTFGLSVDGVVGASTWNVLAYLTTRPDSQLNPYGDWPFVAKPMIGQGAQGDVVRYLQDVIARQCGGNITVSGSFDVNTTQRVKDLQRFFGLAQDGLVGSSTWAIIDHIAKGLN